MTSEEIRSTWEVSALVLANPGETGPCPQVQLAHIAGAHLCRGSSQKGD